MNDTINNGGVGPLVGDVRVGPIDTPNGTSYVYRISGLLSEPYANAESARYASRRAQRVNDRGRLEPVE